MYKGNYFLIKKHKVIFKKLTISNRRIVHIFLHSDHQEPEPEPGSGLDPDPIILFYLNFYQPTYNHVDDDESARPSYTRRAVNHNGSRQVQLFLQSVLPTLTTIFRPRVHTYDTKLFFKMKMQHYSNADLSGCFGFIWRLFSSLKYLIN
jgi:hypothetical protein